MRTLVVCGTFDNNGGSVSSLMHKLFIEYPFNHEMINGGSLETLQEAYNKVVDYDVIFWFANVDNSELKFRKIKQLNPKCILITSKNNYTNEYSFKELISRSIELKANLTVEFVRMNEKYLMRVFDPLGVLWCEYNPDVQYIAEILALRVSRLLKFTRQSIPSISDLAVMPQRFLDIIHNYAETFHKLIVPPDDVKRFLGNVSFRCIHGFPSHRDPSNSGIIFMSKRNVDKTGITEKDFVPLLLEGDRVFNLGNDKPSVDAPVQVRLYKALPTINFIIHGHVYVKDAIYTQRVVPCGALEEVSEILEHIEASEGYKDPSCKGFTLNLLGHGCIILAETLSFFDDIEFEARPIPESLFDIRNDSLLWDKKAR